MSIKRYSHVAFDGMATESADGHWVKHPDHVASHAYDEAKERALFETSNPNYSKATLKRDEFGFYENPRVHDRWQGWATCAQSRAIQ